VVRVELDTDLEGPVDVVDRLLWRDAREIIVRHAGSTGLNHCAWCGRPWPCPPRRCAERALLASCRPWNEAWTARHDLYSLRTMPGWRLDFGRARPRGGWHRAGNNRSTF
jgi:hypothetical protein